MCIGVVSCNYGKFTYSSSSWVFLAFFIYFHMHLPFQSLCLFFPACFTGWDFQSMLSRRESGHLVLLLILGGECSVFHCMYEVSIRLSEMLFIRLKKFPYRPSLQSYNHEWVLNFVKNFLHYLSFSAIYIFCIWDDHMVLLIWWVTLIFQIIKPTLHSWHMLCLHSIAIIFPLEVQ